MPATSPYTANDYRAVDNYRPYQLPINDIYKAIDAQNKFWDAGAARVKNVYENALNLDLTLDSNVELRKNFMEQAQKQMTKLSSMDLSDPSVQRQGFGIFKPLLQDKGIIYDDFLTKKYKEVIADANNWKNDEKTKGEGFNMDNLAFALRPFKGFSNTTSRDQLEGIFGSAKNAEYIPYYDASKERMTILDKCKPDVVSKTTTQGMYLETNKVASVSSQKLWGCLESGLSDRAKQQNRISAVVRYGDDYQALKDDYVEAANNKIDYYKGQIKDLATQKAAVAGKKGYEDFEKGLQDQIDQYTDQLNKLHTDINGDATTGKKGYLQWDDDYMKKNYDDLASFAYFRKVNGAFADAFAKRDIEQSKKSDPVGMMYYTQQKLDDRQAAGFKHDYEMEDYKFRQKLLSGDGSMDDATRLRLMKQYGITDPTLTSTYGTAVMEPGTNSATLKSLIDKSTTDIQNKASEIVSFLQGDPDLSKLTTDVKTSDDFLKIAPKLEEYVKNRLKIDPNDVKALELRDGLNTFMTLTNEKIHHQSILNDAQAFTDTKVVAEFGKKQEQLQNELNSINDGKPINFTLQKNTPNGMDWRQTVKFSLTPQQLQEQYNKGYITFSRDVAALGQTRIRFTGGPYAGYGLDYDTRKADWAGDIVGAREMRHPVGLFIDYLNKNESTENKISDFRNSTLNTYLEGKTAIQKMKFAAGNLLGKGTIDDPKMTAPMHFISSMFGTSLGEQVQFNTVGGFDPVTGWTDIQATVTDGKDKGKSVSASALRDAASKSQFGASSYEESKYPNAIRVKIPYLQNILTAPDYGETLKELMNYASQRVIAEDIPSGLVLDAGIAPTGEKVQIKTSKSLASGTAKYTILVNGTEIPVKIGNDEASTMSYVGKILTGKLDKEIK